MNPVRLEFAHERVSLRQRLLGRTRPGMGALLLLLLAGALTGTAAVAWQAWQADSELGRARASLQALQSHRGQRPARPAGATTLTLTSQRLQAWTQIARQLNTPWAALLDALETHTPDNVALVSIEPDARHGSVRLQAEARTLDALLTYARELDNVESFDGVRLIKHETNEQDANRPVRLSLDIRLKTFQVAPATTAGGAR